MFQQLMQNVRGLVAWLRDPYGIKREIENTLATIEQADQSMIGSMEESSQAMLGVFEQDWKEITKSYIDAATKIAGRLESGRLREDDSLGDRTAKLMGAGFDPQTAAHLVESQMRADPSWAAYLDQQKDIVRSNYVAAALKEAGEGAVALQIVDDVDYGGNYMFYVLVECQGVKTWYLVEMTTIHKDFSPDMA